jgi:hypothetical protein
MRLRNSLVYLTAVLACLTAAGAASAVPGPSSPNMSLVSSIPNAGAIGANFDGKLMYVTGVASGLTIYDISDPSVIVPMGSVPLPHFENENVTVRGGRALISFDGATGVGLFVIDVSNPHTPMLLNTDPISTVGGAGHTAACADPKCNIAYVAGAKKINIIDITDPANAKHVKTFDAKYVGSSHAIDPDQDGLMWIAGGNGTAAFDVTDPRNPVEVANTGEEGKKTAGGCGYLQGSSPACQQQRRGINNFIHHNSQRVPNRDAAPGLQTAVESGTPDAQSCRTVQGTRVERYKAKVKVTKRVKRRVKVNGRWVVRWKKVTRTVVRTKTRRVPTSHEECATAPGTHTSTVNPNAGSQVVLVTEEDWLQPQCAGEGSFQTWRWVPGTGTLKHLDSWWTEAGNVGTDGRRETAATCSSHWFDQRGGFAAVGWYDQGVRLLDVRNPMDIKQVGWAVGGTEVAAYFSPTDPSGQTVYTLDMVGGTIDVWKFARPMTSPKNTRPITVPQRVVNQIDIQRLLGAQRTRVDPHWGPVCRLPL